MMKSCSVFGHTRIDITENLKEKLKLTFETLIVKENVKIFYFGGMGEFDNLCYKIISELKIKYNDVYRIFCLYDPRHQRIIKRPNWLREEDYEEITYLSLDFDYWYNRIYFRNCEMIKRSDYVVFYVNYSENSGSYKALQFAKNKKKQIIKFGCESTI